MDPLKLGKLLGVVLNRGLCQWRENLVLFFDQNSVFFYTSAFIQSLKSCLKSKQAPHLLLPKQEGMKWVATACMAPDPTNHNVRSATVVPRKEQFTKKPPHTNACT